MAEEAKPGTPETKPQEEKAEPINNESYERFKKVIDEKNELKNKLAALEAGQKAAEEEKLKNQNEFKQLAELKSKEAADLAEKLNKKDQDLNNALINYEIQLHAKNAIAHDSTEIIKFIDTSKIKIENGQVTGAKELVEKLKAEKPYLFSSGDVIMPHTDRAIKNKVLTRSDLMKNTKMANELYVNNRAEYDKIMST